MYYNLYTIAIRNVAIFVRKAAMRNLSETFRIKLKALIDSKAVTVTQLATGAKMERSQIYGYIQDEDPIIPKLDAAYRVIEASGQPPKYFFDLDAPATKLTTQAPGNAELLSAMVRLQKQIDEMKAEHKPMAPPTFIHQIDISKIDPRLLQAISKVPPKEENIDFALKAISAAVDRPAKKESKKNSKPA